MLSQLFAGDALLQTVADDQDRISQTRHRTDPAVAKIQTALLIRDPLCLPVSGADGDYGSETAAAVVRFKLDELGVPSAEVVDDVGPRTVIRLDQIASVSEAVQAAGMVMIATPSATADDFTNLHQTVEQAGGDVLLGLGPLAAVVSGGQPVADALGPLVGQLLAGLVTPVQPEIPPAVDTDTVDLVLAWLSTLDPLFLLAHLDPARQGQSFEPLGGCGLEVTA